MKLFKIEQFVDMRGDWEDIVTQLYFANYIFINSSKFFLIRDDSITPFESNYITFEQDINTLKLRRKILSFLYLTIELIEVPITILLTEESFIIRNFARGILQ